jgi:cytochrome c oxidase subunit 1
MYTVGLDVDTRAYFTAATMMIAVPTVLKFLVDLLRLLENYRFTYSYVICIGFYFFIYNGGVTGVILSNGGLDVALHDTYYVVAHFIMYCLWELCLHYLLVFIIGLYF